MQWQITADPMSAVGKVGRNFILIISMSPRKMSPRTKFVVGNCAQALSEIAAIFARAGRWSRRELLKESNKIPKVSETKKRVRWIDASWFFPFVSGLRNNHHYFGENRRRRTYRHTHTYRYIRFMLSSWDAIIDKPSDRVVRVAVIIWREGNSGRSNCKNAPDLSRLLYYVYIHVVTFGRDEVGASMTSGALFAAR